MSEAHCNKLPQRKALGLVTHDNTGGPFVVECQGCGAVYPSFHCLGGEQIADTGDHEDARCPHCDQVDPEECDNAALAWNTQQLKINELQLLLNERDDIDDQLTSLEQRRHAEQQACQAAERRVDELLQSKGLGEVVATLARKYDDTLLPFVALMRKELHANADKGDRPGWLSMSADTCLLEIIYHFGKLQASVKRGDGNGMDEYGADVANMCMMLLDICGVIDLVRHNEQPAPVAVMLAEARQWLGDGKHADGLAREHWTPEYVALIDRIDATLSK